MKKSEIIKTITIIIAFIWHCLMALLTPIWMGILYMFFTGHGKGYDYDLQSEADIYILLALIGVIIWMISTIPVFVFRKIDEAFPENKQKLLVVANWHIFVSGDDNHSFDGMGQLFHDDVVVKVLDKTNCKWLDQRFEQGSYCSGILYLKR